MATSNPSQPADCPERWLVIWAGLGQGGVQATTVVAADEDEAKIEAFVLTDHDYYRPSEFGAVRLPVDGLAERVITDILFDLPG